MKIKGSCVRALLVLGCFCGFNSQAQNLAVAAGVWNGVFLNVPSQLTSVVSQGRVTDVLQNNAFGAGSFRVTVLPNGTFSGDGTGTVSVNGQGAMTVYPDDGLPVYFRVNFAQDVFVGIGNDTDGGYSENALNLAVRAPATLTSNDVAGTWSLMSFATPQQLIEVMAPTANGSALTDLLGFDSNSVPNSSFSQIGAGTMTINPNGTLSGIMEDPFTGTYTCVGTGRVDLIIDTGEGTLQLSAYINAGKDTMFSMNLEGGGNRQEILMLAKNPTSVTPADLQGVWKVTSFHVPSGIALSRNSSNFVIAVTPSGGFGMNQMSFNAGHDGFLTSVFDNQPNIGMFSIGAGGAITVTFTNSAGESESHSGQLNASKDCITLVQSQDGELETTVVTRAPNFPGSSGQDLGMLFFNGAIYWASATNRQLQATTVLSGGSWNNVPATQGLHSYQPAFTNSSGFFRVQGQ